MATLAYLHNPKERFMTDETIKSDELTNREKYALLKEFHRTLRQVLTGTEYKVFCAIEDWSESKGECWHSQLTIAGACDLSIRSVNATIKELESLLLIESKERPGQSSTYTPAQPTYAKIAYLRTNLRKNNTGGYAKSAQPPTQKLRINVSNINGSNNNDIPTPNGVGEQAPATIDFQVTEIYLPVSEPEPQPEQEPVIPLDSKPIETQQTYPARPPEPPKKKGSGISVVEAKARDKPAKKARPRDPRLDHPNVKFYTEHMRYSPCEDEQFDLLVNEEFDLIELEAAMKNWLASGYFRGNVRGVVDTYHKRSFRNDLRGNERGRGERPNRQDRPGPKDSGKSITEQWNQPEADLKEQFNRELLEFGLRPQF